MRPVLGLLAVGVLMSACDGLVVFVSTGPSPIHQAGFVDGGTIFIGATVSGTITTRNSGVQYQVVPPRTGTLVVHVSWEQSLGVIAVQVGGTSFAGAPGGRPPIAARVPVRAGQSYPVEISNSGSSANDTLNLPFVVTTAME